MHISQATSDKSTKAQYFKSSCNSISSHLESANKNFAFNFSLSDDTAPPSTSAAVSGLETVVSSPDDMEKEVAVNYYHLAPSSSSRAPGANSDGGFLFNFDITPDTS